MLKFRKPVDLRDKANLYSGFYRHQVVSGRMPFSQFSAACDLAGQKKHTFAEIARLVSTPKSPISETRMRRLGIFLGIRSGDKSYARRSRSLRYSTKFPGVVDRYLSLRRNGSLSTQRAAAVVGVDRYTALDWERTLLEPEERARLESIARSESNAHSKRGEMRLLLGVKNPDGTFRYPPKAIMDTLGVKVDAIKTANASFPPIRQKADANEVARRFVGGRRVGIPALAKEAKLLLPKLLERQRIETERKNMDLLLTLHENKRTVLETKLTNALHRDGLSPQDFAGLKMILHLVFSAPDYAIPVREIHTSTKIPESMRRNLFASIGKMKTNDGTKIVKIENGAMKLHPNAANYIV